MKQGVASDVIMRYMHLPIIVYLLPYYIRITYVKAYSNYYHKECEKAYTK